MRRYVLLLIAGLVVLALGAAGCQGLATPASSLGINLPTVTPLGTAPAVTGTPAATVTPEGVTAVPTAASPAAGTVIPTATLAGATAAPTAVSPATGAPVTLALITPAAGETIVSPSIVRGQGTVSADRTVTVQILDAQGGVLGQASVNFAPGPDVGQLGAFWGIVRYNPPTATQAGRVVVQTLAPNGDVLAHDDAQVTLRGTTEQPLAGVQIQAPAANATIANPVPVNGQAIFQGNRVLPLQLLDAQGNVLGQGIVQFGVDANMGQAAAFTGSLPFAPPAAAQTGWIVVEQRAATSGQILARDAVQVQVPGSS